MIKDTATRSVLRKHMRAVLADNVRAARQRAGMTQREVAALVAGAHESYIRGVEAGTKDISLVRAVEIADVLGVTVADLLKDV